MIHPHAPRLRTLFATSCLVLSLATTASAATITGTVRNESSVGIGNVDLDFVNQCTGDNIFLSGDKTIADGSFAVVVPSGTYDVRFTPPAGSTVAAAEIQNVVVSVNASLGVVTLHPGRLVSGTVLTPALAPAAGVDLKFVDRVTDRRVYLTKDVTNALGQYSLRVPPGAYDVDFRPPSSTAFGDKVRTNLVVAGSDISGLSDVLLAGFVVNGDVRDRNGIKIKNVDVDVFDVCTGLRVPTAHDNTDVNGNYSVVVPGGDYLFEFNPPACKSLEASRRTGVGVNQDQGLGTETLREAVAVSGVVHDHVGAPLAGVKLKFFDATSAGTPRQATTGDRTDAAGAFAILVPAGTYDVNVEPGAGSDDLVTHLSSVLVAGATNLGTLTLTQGIPVSGHLEGPGGVPALNVGVNAVESATRIPVRLSHHDSDSLGNFTVVVPPGTYDFQYDPPACSGLAPASQANRVIASAATLPSVSLVAGVHVLGNVVDGAALPVGNVDLDVYPAGSVVKAFTPRDQTAGDGTFDLFIAPGVYSIKFVPSSLTRLRPVMLWNQSLPTDLTLPTVTLAEGLLVSGFVKDFGTLAPIPGVTVDFYPPGGTLPLLTSHRTTSATGAYSVSVESGTWDLLYTPPAGSPWPPTWRRGVTVAGDLVLGDQLLDPANVGVAEVPGAATLALSPPAPNPGHGTVRFIVSTGAADAVLSACDVSGRRVATLWQGRATAPMAVQWNGRGDDGAPLPAGIYFVRLAGPGGATRSRPLMWVR